MDFGSTPPAGIAAQQELENLRRVFVAMDVDCDGQISESDISRTLRTFSYTPRKGEVADMIWEVDEDADRHVSWAEFELMFMRCRSDKTGLEPRKLFDVVEFMMHDKDGSGKVSFDECMEILYRRFGKEMLEERTNDFFKADLNGDNEIDFAEFQKQMTSGVDQASEGPLARGTGKDVQGVVTAVGQAMAALQILRGEAERPVWLYRLAIGLEAPGSEGKISPHALRVLPSRLELCPAALTAACINQGFKAYPTGVTTHLAGSQMLMALRG
eukprot:CAMPEP_0206045186 /NCGR_PEP_ID=MMETSP1466-20131121/15214_1 /ASSEMBLY_ACC=CAM_ASM_001126 /TAXON_ID=44452 /ORGANISM="Pavlova gyrans, Strain CCMP608" /LENGTH=270 /DNA_ID=CAMNT_0053420115 /DNA_START=14 /DNA_END=828 /DNA_ORIENTATION=-